METQSDVRHLRALLAEAQITVSAYARACTMSRVYTGRILSGNVHPGELAEIKLRRGLAALGLDREVRNAS